MLRNQNEKLGMNIKGGLRGQPGNPLDPLDEGVFISKVSPGGAAERDGRLRVRIYLYYIYLYSSNKLCVKSVNDYLKKNNFYTG